MAIKVNGTIAIDNNKHCTIGSGTTAQRPTSPAVATLWFNTETNNLEGYNGFEWEDITEPLPPPPPEITAWSWGAGSLGQLGDNAAANRSSPVSVVGGITDWEQISAGFNHSLAQRSDGSLWSWGQGSFGRLGDNDTANRSSPVSVVGGITDWTEILAGGGHSLALRSDGSLWAWGFNTDGRLGDNDTIARSSPVTVVGGITDWEQISAGGGHNLALRSNGSLWAWGAGSLGQLGTNNTLNRSSPVTVVGGITNWTQISAGSQHNLGLRSNGTLWAWGLNNSGQLGTNDTANRSSPVTVVGGITDWEQISAGGGHNLALRSNGTLWAWGRGDEGQQGTNSTVWRSSPVSVVGGITDWTQILAYGSHSRALRSDGTLWAWGFGSSGQLGDNDTANRSSPVSVVGGFTDWTQISAGSQHSVALRAQ